MLTIHKEKGEVNLLIREHDRIWNRTFVFAFCLALSLHLLSFCLFRVHPIHSKVKEIFLPTVEVDAAIPVLADLGKTPIADRFEPKLPKIPLIELPITLRYETAFNPHLDPLIKHHARLHVYGPLASNSRYFSPEETTSGEEISRRTKQPTPQWVGDAGGQRNFPHDQPVHIVYEVRVDNATGRVIWYRSVNGESNANGEKLLEMIRFAGDEVTGLTKGWIEIEVV